MEWVDSLLAEFSRLKAEPNSLVVIGLLLAVFVYLAVTRFRPPRRRGRRPHLRVVRNDGNMANPHNQMDAIHSAEFEVQKLLNSSEARILPVLEDTVSEIGKGHRVMAQTSMGEILRPKKSRGSWQARKDAYASINSKRLDFAIFDRRGYLVCAIEYQGKGHHQGKAFMRDAVKREAVRKAGVAWIEVNPGDKPSKLRAEVRRALGEPPFPPGQDDNARPARTE